MKKSDNTVLWWAGWIILTILAFFVCAAFWTPWIARHVGPMGQKNAAIWWVTAVFGSWMVLLVPLIVVMYSKVDKAYEDARLTREKSRPKDRSAGPFGGGLPYFRSILIDEKKRRLNPALISKIRKMPQAIHQGHLVHAHLKDGRKIENLFVFNKTDVLGVYGLDSINFDLQDIVDIEPSDLDHLPAFESRNWWRFDGAGMPTG